MEFKNEELITTLYIASLQGAFVEPREAYAVLKNPTIHDYYYQNCLIMNDFPQKGDFELWMDLFKRELHLEEDKHRVFIISSSLKENENLESIREFEEHGFSYFSEPYLVLKNFKKPHFFNEKVQMRVIKSEEDYQELKKLRMSTGKEDYYNTPEGRLFEEKRLQAERKNQEEGRASWFGAWIGEELVGAMGLYFIENLGRFQQVETHLSWRKQGICQSLLYHVCFEVFQKNPSLKLVILPASDEVSRIYQKVGFEFGGYSQDLCRIPAAYQKTYRYLFEGRVQGVGFRSLAQSFAQKYHLKGFIRNKENKMVEAFVTGWENPLKFWEEDLKIQFKNNIQSLVKEEISYKDERFNGDFFIDQNVF